MNAHTKIVSGKARSHFVRLRSKAYRQGLREGFGAVALFDAPRVYRFTTKVDASIAGTWRAVGEALRESSDKMGGKNGQATSEAAVAE